MSIGLEHYLVLSAILFSIGLYGALAKRNAIIILMSIELMLNAVNIIVVAAAEAAVGLAIILTIYRSRETIDATKIDLMKW